MVTGTTFSGNYYERLFWSQNSDTAGDVCGETYIPL